MQQQSSRQSSRGDPEVDALLAGMERILLRLADVGPPDRVVVPVVLPLEVAEMMVAQARHEGVCLDELYTACLLHGYYHAALEAGALASARHLAGMIRRLGGPDAWARFAQQHPEAQEG